MKLKVSPVSGPISAGTSVAFTRRKLINSNCIITDARQQSPGLFPKDCLIEEYSAPSLYCPGYNANHAFCQLKCLNGFPPMLNPAAQCQLRYLPSTNGFEVPMSFLSYVFPRSYCQQA